MRFTNSETSRVVMSLARLGSRAAPAEVRRALAASCPSCAPEEGGGGFLGWGTTSLGRDPRRPSVTSPGSPHILTSGFSRLFLPRGPGAFDFKDRLFPHIPRHTVVSVSPSD